MMFPPPYEKLARFAGNLATCLEAGVGVEKSLEKGHAKRPWPAVFAARLRESRPLPVARQVREVCPHLRQFERTWNGSCDSRTSLLHVAFLS